MLSLSWNNHSTTFCHMLSNLRQKVSSWSHLLHDDSRFLGKFLNFWVLILSDIDNYALVFLCGDVYDHVFPFFILAFHYRKGTQMLLLLVKESSTLCTSWYSPPVVSILRRCLSTQLGSILWCCYMMFDGMSWKLCLVICMLVLLVWHRETWPD